MSIEKEIYKRLEQNLSCSVIEVINESYKHRGHAGDNGTNETHFKVIIASKELEGLSRLQQHKLINGLVSDLFARGLHALSLKINS